MSERKVAYTKINGKVFDDKGEHRETGGSKYSAFNEALLQQALQSQWFGNADEAEKTEKVHATIGALTGTGPKDEIEGMLAAQMLATHNAAMECYRRAMLPSQTFEGRDSALTQANKLTRSYAALVGALDKHRGKGKQTVRVEHVHIHKGGKAIIGSVSSNSRRSEEPEAEAAVRQIGHLHDDPLSFDAEVLPEHAFEPRGGGGLNNDG